MASDLISLPPAPLEQVCRFFSPYLGARFFLSRSRVLPEMFLHPSLAPPLHSHPFPVPGPVSVFIFLGIFSPSFFWKIMDCPERQTPQRLVPSHGKVDALYHELLFLFTQPSSQGNFPGGPGSLFFAAPMARLSLKPPKTPLRNFPIFFFSSRANRATFSRTLSFRFPLFPLPSPTFDVQLFGRR